MIHTIEIDDNTELGKKALTLLSDLGIEISDEKELNPYIKKALDVSLEQSFNGNLYSNDEVIKRTKEWLNSK
ncbi:MAG: hypothetical protein ACOYMA_17115 [Bacteroidia bacterium]